MTTTDTRPLRIHWWIGDGRPLCLYDAPRVSLTEDERQSTPFCGACLVLLTHLRLQGEWLWDECAAPDLRPSESIALLAPTTWSNVFALDEPAGTDTWWFEQGA